MQVEDELVDPNNDISSTLKWIAEGPREAVKKYAGYSIDGCHFHTKSHDNSHVQQNSGVSLVAKTMQISSAKDKNPKDEDMTFYGMIQEIWEVNYNDFTHTLFKCDWVKSTTGIKVDEFGFILVKLGSIGHQNDTFVVASHVKKVFYIEDPKDPRWSVVLATPHMDWLNEDDLGDTAIDHPCFTQAFPSFESFDAMPENEFVYVRDDCEGTWVEYAS